MANGGLSVDTGLEGFTIRGATASDLGVILSFIRDLAEYERLLHEVVATEDSLREWLFGERRVAEVLIGEWQHRPVAFALFFHNFSTFLGKPGIYLEDLFVKPEMRGKGIGRLMLTYLAQLARERGCGRLEWSVLNWNEPAIRFYRSIGAVPMDGWTVNRLTGEALETLAGEFRPHPLRNRSRLP
ncbi:MAG: GNAT family N-acetyltransferase [Ectothiorhodospiraceae bacterium]|nr:GNAT family N-acetyltransferase [Ectothiorhodospiraceae bacterium]